MVKFPKKIVSDIYKLAPKMASEASKWTNLNLQTIFGAFLCVKTPRFSVGKFWGMIAPPPPPLPPAFRGLIKNIAIVN